MSKNLVIVESPAKAKTIEGYLGKDYTVASSYGHVRDLPKGNKAIDIKNKFRPTYTITKDKEDVIKELKRLAKNADMVWLATDDDREGEAISWHLKEALELTDDQTKRIVFREITKNAILNAIQNPRGIDLDLVNAQQARRILDRLVGFELSPVLWKKIRTGLSAGRVQSVAVRLVVEREREILQFVPENSFRVTADFSSKGKAFQAERSKRLETVEDAKSWLESCKEAAFTVVGLQKKPAKKTPAAPFTTSTLQQEASRKLGMSPARTMSVAQKLYESGKITYMRTDSLNLSKEARDKASAVITKDFGDRYLKNRTFTTKSKGAQEAHEAIRPTEFSNKSAGNDHDERRLYDLIWKRAIASQMADAELERTTAKIGISTMPNEELTAKGEIITFEGFLNVYMESSDEEEEDVETFGNMKVLPPLEVNETLDLLAMQTTERFTKHKPRYTEASLVKELEEKGIGRPSTYAPTLSTITKRNYVAREDREGKERKYRFLELKNEAISEQIKTETTGAEKKKLFPTDLGMVVTDFLVKHFPDVTDYSFTAKVEEDFDEISRGKTEWDQMIENFYNSFHPKVEESENVDRTEANKDRYLGVDPLSGKKIIARLGRYGPMVQKGENTEDEKAEYASLQKGMRLETVSLEEALELFKLPRYLGEFEELEMMANVGRFGPYILHNKKFYSIPKEMDPLTITAEDGIEIIKQKREEDAKKLIKTFAENEEVTILNGRWGPYIKFGKQNVKIPKDRKEEPEGITYEECVAWAEEAAKSPAKGRRGAKAKAPEDDGGAEKKPTPKAPKKKTTKSKTPASKTKTTKKKS